MLLSPSEAALWLATHAPGVARVGTRLWARATVRRRRQPHWLLLRLKSELNLRFQEEVRLKSGHSIFLDPFDEIGREIVTEGYFEPETVRVFEALVCQGMVFVDAGANIGQYSLIASKLVGPRGQVHAFEPDPVTFQRLR